MTPHIHRISMAALSRIRRPHPVYKPLPPPDRVSAMRSIMCMCTRMGISVDDVLSEKRTRNLANARFIVARYLREECNLSFQRIAEVMNRQNHSTVVYYISRYRDLVTTKDREFLAMINKLKK